MGNFYSNKVAVFIVLLSFYCLRSYANTNTEHIGYWWYQDPKPSTELEADLKYKLAPMRSQAELMMLHPKELEKILEERLDYAVWKGDPEKIADYYKVQDIVRRKALMFTALSEYTMMLYPELNAKSQYHVSNAGQKTEKNVRKDQINARIIKEKDNYALIVFTSPKCSYCPTQVNTLHYFSDRHAWNFREINIDQNSALAARYNVTTTPMTIMIKKDSDRWMPVSIGLSAVVTIEENAYRSIRLLSGEITPQEYITPEHQRDGFFDPTYTGNRYE